MLGRPLKKMLARGVGFLLLLSMVAWIGCGTPRERYKILSTFFDGVPNPDAPKVTRTAMAASTQPGVVAMPIVSRHKPFVDNKCESCHRSSTGVITEFSEAFKACVKCHTTVTKKYARMHGPVSQAACRWCHTPHESTEPYLLKGPSLQVCTQCHDDQLLGKNPVQHGDKTTSCVSCHNGHGGTAAFFLKPNAKPDWPTTAPATLPAETRPTGSALLGGGQTP